MIDIVGPPSPAGPLGTGMLGSRARRSPVTTARPEPNVSTKRMPVARE